MSDSTPTTWSPSRGPISTYRRRLPVGAEPIERGLTHVRVWAPRARRVQVVITRVPGATAIAGSDAITGTNTITATNAVAGVGLQGVPSVALEPEAGGYHSGTIKAGLGDRYQFKLDDDARLYPDPASRFQPEGPHGPSEIVDPHTFRWTDQAWTGVALDGQVVYEMHVGTFTRAGTFAAAAEELRENVLFMRANGIPAELVFYDRDGDCDLSGCPDGEGEGMFIPVTIVWLVLIAAWMQTPWNIWARAN